MSFRNQLKLLKLWIACASIVLFGLSTALMFLAVQIGSNLVFWFGLGLTALTLYGIIWLVPETLGRK